jgi:hypothetical protein
MIMKGKERARKKTAYKMAKKAKPDAGICPVCGRRTDEQERLLG